MVVLTEEFHGLTLKRKGADEPDLFDAAGGGDRSGVFPISCRATKMRRLACPETGVNGHQGAPAAAGVMAMGQQDDVPMCDDEPAPVSTGGGEEECSRALVLYGGGGGRSDSPRVALRGSAEWLRAMLREADSRTVRELLAGAAAQEHGSDGLALALVPWVPPSSLEEEETEPSTAAEASDGGDDEGAAAMDVEEDEAPVRHWTEQPAWGSGAGEGFVYRWPQHCMAPQQMPAVAQASPVMWSW